MAICQIARDWYDPLMRIIRTLCGPAPGGGVAPSEHKSCPSPYRFRCYALVNLLI